MASFIVKVSKTTWRARFPVNKDETGRQHYRCATFRTETEAKAWIADLKAKRSDGQLVAKLSKEPLAPFFERWVSARAASGNIRASSAESYRQAFACYLAAPLGQRPISEITLGEVEELLADAVKRFAPRSVRYAFFLLRAVLTHARGAGAIERNVTDRVDRKVYLPKKPRRAAVYHVPTADEVQAIIDASRSISDGRHTAMLILMFHTGMRPGEVFGLRWQDVQIDNDQPQVHVRQSLTVTGRKKLGTRSVGLTDPKTEASNRKIEIVDAIAEVLRTHRARQREATFKREGRALRDSDHVFCSVRGTPLLRHNVLHFLFHPARAAAADALYGVDGVNDPEHWKALRSMRLYDARHAMITTWISKGVDVETVRARAGHADAATTLGIYTHPVDGTQRAAVERLSTAL